MEILTIELSDEESKVFKGNFEKFNVKIIKTEASLTPNSLTRKTIKNAHEEKGIGKPIKNIRVFINAL